MKGRRPKPSHLKLVTGNPGKRPLNRNEPRPTTPARPPAPPAHLSSGARDVWLRDSDGLHALGLLTGIDLTTFAAYCEIAAELAEVDAAISEHGGKGVNRFLMRGSKKQPVLNPLRRQRSELRAALLRYATEFGMTPSARTRVSATSAPEEEDPAEEFFR